MPFRPQKAVCGDANLGGSRINWQVWRVCNTRRAARAAADSSKLSRVIDGQQISHFDHSLRLLRDALSLADQGGGGYQSLQIYHAVDGLHGDQVRRSECGDLREESAHLVADLGVRGA